MKYHVKMLVWYETYNDVNEAIARVKQLKKWERKWKLALIEGFNPEWRDLDETLNARPPRRGLRLDARMTRA